MYSFYILSDLFQDLANVETPRSKAALIRSDQFVGKWLQFTQHV